MLKITLKAARINAGFTLEQVANRLNVTVSTVRNWENGNTEPKINQAYELCELYCVSLDSINFSA